MGTGSFPGVKSGRGVTVTTHHPSSAVVMKEQSYTSTPPMGRTACTEPQCLYKGALFYYKVLENSSAVVLSLTEISISPMPMEVFHFGIDIGIPAVFLLAPCLWR